MESPSKKNAEHRGDMSRVSLGVECSTAVSPLDGNRCRVLKTNLCVIRLLETILQTIIETVHVSYNLI